MEWSLSHADLAGGATGNADVAAVPPARGGDGKINASWGGTQAGDGEAEKARRRRPLKAAATFAISAKPMIMPDPPTERQRTQ
jgi:hypothetical protein